MPCDDARRHVFTRGDGVPTYPEAAVRFECRSNAASRAHELGSVQDILPRGHGGHDLTLDGWPTPRLRSEFERVDERHAHTPMASAGTHALL